MATRGSLGGIAAVFRVSEEASEEISGWLKGEVAPPGLSTNESAPEVEDEDLLRDREQEAREFLEDRLHELSWEDMQKLVAGLLRGMGYKTKVASPGKDRGRDIIASPDGFGFESPRILVEVKHRKGAMGAPELRSFSAGLRPGDKGLYVSTGGFTQEAKYEAERANHTIHLMDVENLVDSIVEHYDTMDMESRRILPLKKIYWPA